MRRADGVSVADWGDWGWENRTPGKLLGFGVCMVFSRLKSRGNEVTPLDFDLTANFWIFCSVCLARHSNVPCKKQRSGLGANRHQGEPSCPFWFWLKHSNLKPSEFKIGCVFSLGETGVLPQVGETWPLGAWACHVASGIWSRALGWRLLRVKL